VTSVSGRVYLSQMPPKSRRCCQASDMLDGEMANEQTAGPALHAVQAEVNKKRSQLLPTSTRVALTRHVPKRAQETLRTASRG